MTWFMENVPDVDKKADDGDAAFGTIDSWLVYKLTKGKSYKTDYSNASRTQLLNLTTLKWMNNSATYLEYRLKHFLKFLIQIQCLAKLILKVILKSPFQSAGYLGIPMVRCLDTTAEKKVR